MLTIFKTTYREFWPQIQVLCNLNKTGRVVFAQACVRPHSNDYTVDKNRHVLKALYYRALWSSVENLTFII